MGVLVLTFASAAVASPGEERGQFRPDHEQALSLDRLRAIDPDLVVSWDPRAALPRSLGGRLSPPSTAPVTAIALEFLRDHQGLFRLADVEQELTPPLVERDATGMTHLRLRQVSRGVPILGGELRLHLDRSGAITSVEAELLPRASLPTVPVLSAAAGAALARKALGEGSVATAKPELLILDAGRFTGAERDDRLAWRVMLVGPTGEWVSFVDATSGEIVLQYGNSHRARDREIRSDVAAGCNLGTLLFNEAGPVVADPGADATNAYVFTGAVHAYYLGTHGRDSFDGNGARMVAVTDWSAAQSDWSPSCLRTRFGRGWATRDLVAHEWQHGVTQTTAGLLYVGEPGALNESMSDVFGAMVDRDDWLIGEDAPGGYLRSLADPRISRPPQPDTNDGADPNAGVHVNSGIPNKVAYLVSAGGSHHGLFVSAQGREATESIWYRALRFHIGSTTDFAGAREATLNAATELYGSGSSAVCAVMSAWASVAIGQPCVNDASFVTQSLPTVMLAGVKYTVSVLMRNTGTTTWTRSALYRLGSQSPQDNLTWGVSRANLPTSVAPDGLALLTFTITAPSTPGTYSFRWRMLRELVEWFGASSAPVSVAVLPNAKLIAGYVPAPGAARATFTSTSANPPAFNFYYNEAAGSFHQQPGFPCHAGQNNPTYVSVSFQMPPISACTFQGSWDLAPFSCGPEQVAFVNSGGSFVLNTDRYETDLATCALFSPLRSIVPFNAPAWFRVEVVIGGVVYARTLNFVKAGP